MTSSSSDAPNRERETAEALQATAYDLCAQLSALKEVASDDYRWCGAPDCDYNQHEGIYWYRSWKTWSAKSLLYLHYPSADECGCQADTLGFPDYPDLIKYLRDEIAQCLI